MAGAVRQSDRAGSGRGEAPGAAGLLALLLASAALALALWEISGLPRAPDAARIGEVLSGAELPAADAAAAAAAAGWLILLYLALSVGLRLALLVAARLSGGAKWARAGLRVSTLLTIPAVRRLVDGGVGGALLAASWLPLPAPGEDAGSPAYAAAAQQAPPGPHEAGAPAAREARRSILYTVAPGDDLWEIARRVHGDGSRFVEIVEANRGRAMEGGERFTGPALLRPGWVLRVPEPAPGVEARDGVLAYRVRRGDHLWGIAERFLGDGFRWVEIWERNRGREMDDGSRLTDPDRLRPGWVLEVPVRDGGALPAARAPEAAAGPAEGAGEPGLPGSPGGGAAAAGLAGDGGGSVDDGRDREWPRLPGMVVWSAAGFAVIGGTAVFVQRLRRADPGRDSGAGGNGTGDAGRVALAAGALETALSDIGFSGSLPLLVLERDAGLEVTVACPPGDAAALLAARHDLERRLDSGLEAAPAGPARVVLTLPGSGRLPAGLAPAPRPSPGLVVPVGASEAGVVYLNLAAAGAVAVAGEDGERRALLRSWLATLRSIRPPDRLSIRADSGAARLLRTDAALPDPGGAPAAGDLADELDELIRSRVPGDAGNRPVVAVFDLAGDADPPAGAMRHGPASGVYVICCLPPDGSAGTLVNAGASVTFGEPSCGGDTGTHRTPRGAIALGIGRNAPMPLDPVHVRRDTSARWSPRAHAAAPERPDGVSGTPPDPPGPDRLPPGGDDARPGGARADGVVPADVPTPAGEPSGPAAHDGGGHGSAPRALAGPGGEPPAVSPGPTGDPGHDAGGESASMGPAGRPERPHDDAGPAPVDSIPRARSRPEDAAPPVARDTPAERAPEDPAPAPDKASAGAAHDGAPARGAGRASPAVRQSALLTDQDLAPGAHGDPPVARTVFSVRCLGRFELRLGAAAVDDWPIAKSRELLAFLAAHGGRPVPRESVAEALWPEYPWDASVRHTIANAVSGLRGVVRSAAGDAGLQPVITARQRYQLQVALFRVDLDEFESAVRRASALADAEALAEYERAAALSGGDFLEGEPFPWLDAYRADYRLRAAEAAGRGAQVAERLGERERAALLYRAVLEREPTDEAAARGLMRQLAAARDVTGVRKVFKALTEALRRELDDPGAVPGPETRALLADLLAGERGTAG